MACADLEDLSSYRFSTVSLRGALDIPLPYEEGPEGRGHEGRGPEESVPEGRGPEGRGSERRGLERRGPEDRGPEGGLVLCTYCLHHPEPAVKTCVTCDASLCQKHLQVHSTSGRHELFEPTCSLVHRKCPIHKEPLTHYCTEDFSILCHVCLVIGEHKEHQVESLHDASEKKKETLRRSLKKCHSRKEKAQKRISRLQEKIEDVNTQGNTLTDNISSLFSEFEKQLKALGEQMVEEVREGQKKVTDSIHEQVRGLEIKLKSLSDRISSTEELCNTTDPLAVMKEPMTGDANASLAQETARRMSDDPDPQDLDVVFIIMTLRRHLSKIIHRMSQRKGFYIPGASDMALNANTAGDFVFISGDGKSACKTKQNLLRPETPEKFYCPQALSRKSFSSGRHAWEVEAGGSGEWMIGVAYPSIERKGPLSFIGINNKSWCLQRSGDKYSVMHNTAETLVGAESSCSRYFIYLDYDAGRLSFYQLSDPINHLHTFKANFTEPLHAAFTVEDDAWVRICS